MELFDIRTLIFIGGCLKIIFAILLFIHSHHTTEVKAAISVTLSNLLSGIGLLILCTYPKPFEVVNLATSNSLIILGDSLFLRGLWILKKKKINWLFIYTVVFLSLTQTVLFTSIYNHPGIRMSINSFIFASIGFYIFYEFINPLVKSLRVIFIFNAIIFLSYVTLMIIRGFAVMSRQEVILLESTPVNIAMYVFILVAQTLAVFSFIIILNLLLAESLKKQVQIRNRFYSILGHDLRNPIANIIGYCELLKDRQLDINTRKPIETMYTAAKQADKLVLSILDWVNAQREGTVDIKKINLSALLEEEREFYSSIATPKEIKIKFFKQEKSWIIADKNMLKTIIRNLVSNAVKFSNPEGIVSITIKSEGNITNIIIADNGVGMSLQTIYDILENRNVQTTKGTKNEPGTGLGLILCHEFIEKMNGKLGLESSLGNGSSFIVSLPRS